jgi:cytochrome c oxidase subunit 4
MMTGTMPSNRVYYAVAAALMLLLAATIVAAELELGVLANVVTLGIALTKAVLVALFFMHLRYREPAMRVFALAGLFWLVILFALTLSDYVTRA